MPDKLTQEGRLISVNVEGQAKDTLLLQSFTGIENISRPYIFQLEVITETQNLDFTQIIGKKAQISLRTSNPSKLRYFHGYVSQFAQSDAFGNIDHYRMEVVPWIWFLTLNTDCRIFHNLTIPEIVKKVLDTSPARQKDSIDIQNVQKQYTKLEYCVQYRESSLNFISRLMEHAGIFYYFTHTEDGHTIHLSDNSNTCVALSAQSTVSYSVKDVADEETIQSLRGKQTIRTGAHTQTNYNFKTPSADLTTTESTVVNVGQNDPLEIFEYPGTHTTVAEGRDLSLIRMQEQEASHHLLSGTGNVRTFMSGFTYTLKRHPQGGPLNRNIQYLITQVRHMATNGGIYLGGSGGESYSNQFSCIPSSVPFRPARSSPKPFVQGPQTAIVIGKSDYTDSSGDDGGGDGEEIWVDEYGRVVVRFPWDRAGNCSCRVRVSQAWAGEGWGGMTIPRVGQEVIVSFLEGDPDRPIITGRVYNANQTVPYTLPDYQTRTTFMTRSSKGGGADNYNELRFEDKKGSEQIFLRGEHDLDTRMKNDVREWVGNNRSVIVTKDEMAKVSGDQHEQVTGNTNQKIGQNLSIQVGQNLYEKSGTNFAHEAGQVIHLKAGTTVVIEAGTELTLKVGGNFIDINPSGISIVGTMVMINSGGSAGSGPGSSPTDPKDPDQADDGSKGGKM